MTHEHVSRDDTAAIQAAINAAVLTGGIVYFPGGRMNEKAGKK